MPMSIGVRREFLLSIITIASKYCRNAAMLRHKNLAAIKLWGHRSVESKVERAGGGDWGSSGQPRLSVWGWRRGQEAQEGDEAFVNRYDRACGQRAGLFDTEAYMDKRTRRTG